MAQAPSPYRFQIHTYGCKVNTYDSGLISQRLEHRRATEGPMVHIFNTCAVTKEATKQAIKEARRVRARDPLATIVLTGCAAQVDGAELDHLPGIDLVVANSHKGQLAELLDRHFRGDLQERVFRSNIFRKEDLEAGGGVEAAHTRTFLKIQDGCNSFCSFCVIPYARGKSRSISISALVDRVRELHASGWGEVVLTGVHIGDYLDETRPESRPRDLSALVDEILAKTSIARLRLSSLEPIEITESLWRSFENPRLCAHFHMSIQSANSKVLKEMKRQYGQEEVRSALIEISRRLPNAFVGMDVIAGFPGESDEEFEDTFQCLQSLPWTRLHVFPYSERPGTKAAVLMAEQSVPLVVRKERARRLRALSSSRYRAAALKQIGQKKSVLILKSPRPGYVLGLTPDYWHVQIPFESHEQISQVLKPGQETVIEITGFDEADLSRMDALLIGRLIDSVSAEKSHWHSNLSQSESATSLEIR